MEITDDEFPQLWQEIREALVSIAGQIIPAKKTKWEEAIDNFLKDPLTAEDKRNVQELLKWYENDEDVKQSIEKFKTSTQEGMERLETSLEGVKEGLEGTAHVIEETAQFLENAVKEEAKCIKDQLGGELKTATKNVQCLVQEEAQSIKDQLGGELKATAQNVQCLVREEVQDIKDKLDEVHQSIDGLRSTAGSSQASGVKIRVRMDCEAIPGPGPRGGASEMVTTSPEPQHSVQSATVMPIAPYQQQAASSMAAFSGENVPYAGIPPTQEVLNFIALKYFQSVDTSRPEELNGFVKYLRDVRNVLVLDAQQGSLIIILECSSLEILEGLWGDYCSGLLNEMAQKYLVTEDILKEFGFDAVKLMTTILEEEYTVCRMHFLRSAGLSGRQSMAFVPPSVVSTKEKTNYARLYRLLVDVGSQALRDTFDSVHRPAELHLVLGSHPVHVTLQSLRERGILNPIQWGELYPIIPSSVSSASFDMTLLMVLLRNICGLTPPVTGWDSLPSAADASIEANIARVKFYRNILYGYASQASVDDATFNAHWQDISNALVALGGASYGAAINKLKNECMDPKLDEHYKDLLAQWKKDEDRITEKLEDIKVHSPRRIERESETGFGLLVETIDLTCDDGHYMYPIGSKGIPFRYRPQSPRRLHVRSAVSKNSSFSYRGQTSGLTQNKMAARRERFSPKQIIEEISVESVEIEEDEGSEVSLEEVLEM